MRRQVAQELGLVWIGPGNEWDARPARLTTGPFAGQKRRSTPVTRHGSGGTLNGDSSRQPRATSLKETVYPSNSHSRRRAGIQMIGLVAASPERYQSVSERTPASAPAYAGNVTTETSCTFASVIVRSGTDGTSGVAVPPSAPPATPAACGPVGTRAGSMGQASQVERRSIPAIQGRLLQRGCATDAVPILVG